MTSPDAQTPIEALITDLDGTFWAPGMVIHAASHAAVREVDAAGIAFVIATGRRGQSALNGLQPAGYGSRPGILMNGAIARDALDGDSFQVLDISTERSAEVLEVFRNHDLEPVAYIDDPQVDMVVGPKSDASSKYLASTVGYQFVDSLDDAVATRSVVGFGAFGFDYDLLQPIADELNGQQIATAIIGRALYEGGHGIMVQGHAVDKQTGIDAWCARHGVNPQRVAVVGDGNNDIGMLSAAAIAIVPSDAAPEIQALADVVIAPNEEGGWEQIPSILGL